jgi:hypothetical protein
MMMKKLLVLMLVLGLAGVAQAVGSLDLVISSRGPGPDSTEPIDPVHEITIMESEWINMDIIYIPGTPVLFQCSVTITASGPGTLDISSLTFPEGAWDFNYEDIRVVTEGKVYNIQESFGQTGTGVADGIAIDHILLHCDSPEGDVIVTIVDWVPAGAGSLDYGGPVDVIGTVIVHQVPEPMTVALLGLGGLFLLRRRK